MLFPRHRGGWARPCAFRAGRARRSPSRLDWPPPPSAGRAHADPASGVRSLSSPLEPLPKRRRRPGRQRRRPARPRPFPRFPPCRRWTRCFAPRRRCRRRPARPGPGEPRALGRAQRRLAEREPARRHRGLEAGARQIRPLGAALRGGGNVRQPDRRRPPGLRGQRRHDRSGAAGHEAAVRSRRRHPQRQRLSHLGRRSQRLQSPEPADRQRARGARLPSPLGALVSAEFGRALRRQDRRTEPRQRVHDEPERRLFPELGDGLADAAVGEPAGRRPRLPARGPGGSRARPSVRRRHDHGRRFQREPDSLELAEHPAKQSQRRELPAEHRRSRDRRTAIHVSGGLSVRQARRRRPAARHVQDRRLVRQRGFRQPAIRQSRRPARQPREQRLCRRRSRAIIRSTPWRTR